jgi:hypothetical protein
MEMSDLFQIVILGVSTGFGSAIGTELGKAFVKKVIKSNERSS